MSVPVCASGPVNMAADLALLARPDRACRIYTWDGPWVSLGRFQKPERAVVPGFANWVIRPTGGKAVLHGHDVTVALAFPFERGPHAVREAFTLAVAPLVEALNRCGLPCEVASTRRHPREPVGGSSGTRARPRPVVDREVETATIKTLAIMPSEGVRSADCFAVTSGFDVVHRETGDKVCGCALLLTEGAVLMQASIPYGEPLIDPATAIVGGKRFPVCPWDHQALSDRLVMA